MRNLLFHTVFTLISLSGLGQTFSLSDSTFEVGSVYEMQLRFGMHGEVLEDSQMILDSIALFLKQHENIEVEFGSHTDLRGKDSANMSLSQNRANWVRNYLINEGVNENQIVAKGYGESYPKIPENEINKYLTTDKRKFHFLHLMNRRDVLKIIKVSTQ